MLMVTSCCQYTSVHTGVRTHTYWYTGVHTGVRTHPLVYQTTSTSRPRGGPHSTAMPQLARLMSSQQAATLHHPHTANKAWAVHALCTSLMLLMLNPPPAQQGVLLACQAASLQPCQQSQQAALLQGSRAAQPNMQLAGRESST